MAARLGNASRTGVKNSDWKKYLAAAGIEDFHWHDLRHTFARRLVMKGVDLYTVSKLMGHYRTEVTERNAHPASAHLQSAVDTLTISGVQVTPKGTPAKEALA
jgi:site-specific recombinase XerD